MALGIPEPGRMLAGAHFRKKYLPHPPTLFAFNQGCDCDENKIELKLSCFDGHSVRKGHCAPAPAAVQQRGALTETQLVYTANESARAKALRHPATATTKTTTTAVTMLLTSRNRHDSLLQ